MLVAFPVGPWLVDDHLAGEGRLGKDGKRMKLDVKKGDVVLFGKYAGSDVQVDGEDLKILRESEILAKVEG